MDLEKPESTSPNGPKYQSAVMNYEFECKEQMSNIRVISLYSGPVKMGTMLKTVNYKEQDFEDVMPDTMMAKIMKHFCAK